MEDFHSSSWMEEKGLNVMNPSPTHPCDTHPSSTHQYPEDVEVGTEPMDVAEARIVTATARPPLPSSVPGTSSPVSQQSVVPPSTYSSPPVPSAPEQLTMASSQPVTTLSVSTPPSSSSLLSPATVSLALGRSSPLPMSVSLGFVSSLMPPPTVPPDSDTSSFMSAPTTSLAPGVSSSRLTVAPAAPSVASSTSSSVPFSTASTPPGALSSESVPPGLPPSVPVQSSTPHGPATQDAAALPIVSLHHPMSHQKIFPSLPGTDVNTLPPEVKDKKQWKKEVFEEWLTPLVVKVNEHSEELKALRELPVQVAVLNKEMKQMCLLMEDRNQARLIERMKKKLEVTNEQWMEEILQDLLQSHGEMKEKLQKLSDEVKILMEIQDQVKTLNEKFSMMEYKKQESFDEKSKKKTEERSSWFSSLKSWSPFKSHPTSAAVQTHQPSYHFYTINEEHDYKSSALPIHERQEENPGPGRVVQVSKPQTLAVQDIQTQTSVAVPNQSYASAQNNKAYSYPEGQQAQSLSTKSYQRHPISDISGPLGLPNVGNSCYMGVVLQCLYHLQEFSSYFIDHNYRKVLNNGHPGRELVESVALVFQYLHMKDPNIRIAVERFKATLGKYDPHFQGSRQHEAHDLLGVVLTCLHDALVTVMSPEKHLEKSYISALFQGIQKSIITCKESGSELSNIEEPFSSISLCVARSESLENLLERHFMEQSINWECTYCRTTHKCGHRSHIINAPVILIIHLSRYTEDAMRGYKNFVDYPERLELISHPERGSRKVTTFMLKAVCYHDGSVSQGHYSASCFNYETGEWHLFQDQYVTPQGNVYHSKDTAHILFYKAKQEFCEEL